MPRLNRIAMLAAGVSTLAGASAALADEGMWLPSQAGQIALQLREAGLELDPAALSDPRAAPLNAIVSLGGCSASFVSPEGLVVTNHHCVVGSIQYNSSPENDYLTNGFLAAELDDELPAAPGSRVTIVDDPPPSRLTPAAAPTDSSRFASSR